MITKYGTIIITADGLVTINNFIIKDDKNDRTEVLLWAKNCLEREINGEVK